MFDNSLEFDALGKPIAQGFVRILVVPVCALETPLVALLSETKQPLQRDVPTSCVGTGRMLHAVDKTSQCVGSTAFLAGQ
jgi:hypothetical protein